MAATESNQLAQLPRATTMSLRNSERRFRQLADAIPLLVWTAHPSGEVDYCNRQWEIYTGLSAEQNRGKDWTLVLHPDDRQRCLDSWAVACAAGVPYEIECRFKRGADGADRWHLERVIPFRDEGGVIVKWLGAGADIDDQVRAHEALNRVRVEAECLVGARGRENAEQRQIYLSAVRSMAMNMAHQARHDNLTGLPNRTLLIDRIAQAIARPDESSAGFALMFLDLDNFKHVNDALGHAIGDQLLRSVAQRLSTCVRGSDTLSRQGGDEFAILLSDEHENPRQEAALTADKVLAALVPLHSIGEHRLHVTVSIGISVYPDDARNAETLIRHADTAMYCAKAKGRNNYRFFQSEMSVRATERQAVEGGLRQALERDELLLYYQPKVNLQTGVITGAEALLRWRHPQRGLLLPEAFIAIAEDSGLIVPIGRWVLREACAQTRRWEVAGLQLGAIAVNVSALEFRREDFVAAVSAVLRETGLAPGSLQLEITESALMHDMDASILIMHRLKELGIQLAVDDFGTGYSSLSYLHHFPVDVLKIDQSFVREIATTSGSGVILSAVIAMGNGLKQCVVAEGVELQAQLDFLRRERCEEGQGYFFSPPLAADGFAMLLATGVAG